MGVTEVGPVAVAVEPVDAAANSDKVKGIMVSFKWILELSNLSTVLLMLLLLLSLLSLLLLLFLLLLMMLLLGLFIDYKRRCPFCFVVIL